MSNLESIIQRDSQYSLVYTHALPFKKKKYYKMRGISVWFVLRWWGFLRKCSTHILEPKILFL